MSLNSIQLTQVGAYPCLYSVPSPPSFLINFFPKALSFDRCVQVFYGFGDEKLVKMIDEVKVPADLKLNSDKVAPKAFVKVKLKAESHQT